MSAADLSRLDTALPVLIARVDALAAQKRAHMAAGLLAEDRHQCDPTDHLFAALPCPHPEACATDADYPEWAAELAEQIRISNTTRRTR
ncbi:hypothetical protein [Streptomyces rubiginosohelvolus]|uniref:hypothetical protein n=1 Tax=Streptomyces rubiginosohelvolus TaxID=67362 RepID=UPI0036C6605C